LLSRDALKYIYLESESICLIEKSKRKEDKPNLAPMTCLSKHRVSPVLTIYYHVYVHHHWFYTKRRNNF